MLQNRCKGALGVGVMLLLKPDDIGVRQDHLPVFADPLNERVKQGAVDN
jgi:hypothetical protein